MHRGSRHTLKFMVIFVALAGMGPSLASAQLQGQISGGGTTPTTTGSAGAPPSGQRPPEASDDSERRLKLGILGEVGWRWVALGHGRIRQEDQDFMMAFHGAIRLDLGGPLGGLYTYARFDGFAPQTLVRLPWSAQVRIGYFRNVHYWDAGGPRSSTSRRYTGTSCGYSTCYDHYRTTTRTWWEPAGWVHGLRYFYVACHLMDGTRTVPGSRSTQMAGSVGVGLGIVETKFTTWFAETELLVFPPSQWRDDRSQWGYYLRAGSMFGPVFIDLTLLLDPAMGGELSVGLGVMLGG